LLTGKKYVTRKNQGKLSMSDYQPRLKEQYSKSIRPALMQELGIENVMQVPKLEKIVINVGFGDAVQDSKKLDKVVADLSLIAGQKPVVTKAKKSIATFKVREGMPMGCKVTLRRDHMYEFLDRLVTIAMPRIRDFRGVSGKSFDKDGNYAMGVKEHLIFPEIDYDKIDKVFGMDIVFVSNTSDAVHTKALLKAFGFPFYN
jgi:large subunit ribosomal protein L5